LKDGSERFEPSGARNLVSQKNNAVKRNTYSPAKKYAEAVIFVIDEEPIVVDTLTYYLESAGFENVHGFCDSTAAVAAFDKDRPDVVFTEIFMPGIDGPELMKLMRSCPLLANVPVIAVTAHSSIEISDMMIEAGAQSVILKPFPRDVLVEHAVLAIALSRERPVIEWPAEPLGVLCPQVAAAAKPNNEEPVACEKSTRQRWR
jgi:CheY-like chemotaxis protein